jgi:hypothetical protein
MTETPNEVLTPHTPPPDTPPPANEDPFIPPGALLALAALGIVVAVLVAFTQPTFGVIGYGGIGLAVLSLLAYVLLAPDRARRALTGRTARYGGTSVLVTVLFIGALAAVYTVVAAQGWRLDLTQSNEFSLSESSQAAITGYAADPNLPPVRIIGFYAETSGAARDRATTLLDNYVSASNGKISFEYIDPDRNPQQANLFGVTRAGQFVVTRVNADGSLDSENPRLVNALDQGQLTNAVLAAAAQGNFIAYYLTVRDGESADMSVVKSVFTDRFDWTVEDVSLTDLTAPNSERRLNDPNADGQVLVIPGGSAAFSDPELAIIREYVNAGGDLIVYAGTNLNNDGTALATAENFNQFLSETYGLNIGSETIVDQNQAFQTPLFPGATDLERSAYITSNGIPTTGAAIVFEVPHRIVIAETLPAGVTATALARTSPSSYAIDDVQRILDNDIAQRETDPTGPFVVAAQAENANTGSRVVVFGSTSVARDTYSVFTDLDNISVAVNAMVWTTNFNDFVQTITVPQEQRPQDAPVSIDTGTLRNITTLTGLLLPFGILGAGLLVWWSNRQSNRS